MKFNQREKAEVLLEIEQLIFKKTKFAKKNCLKINCSMNDT